MNNEVSSADLCGLLGVSRLTLSDLARRSIVVRGERSGTYRLEASVSGYCARLREQAAGRGGEDAAAARARLGAAQADLAEARGCETSLSRPPR
jgi:phage terminase Nu1 subunit (DNA packaging protein)